jgi:hypothetical protein
VDVKFWEPLSTGSVLNSKSKLKPKKVHSIPTPAHHLSLYAYVIEGANNNVQVLIHWMQNIEVRKESTLLHC